MKFELLKKYEDILFHEITDKKDLNIAFHVEDDKKNVIENRIKLSQKHNYIAQNLIFMDQIHSNNIQIIEDTSINKIPNCDGIITKIKNIPLMVMVADCIPVLIFDKRELKIAVIHAGREGTYKKIVQKAIKKLNSNPQNLIVCLGPSIHKCCYEVDLQALNLEQLFQMGIKKENIEISNICTCCHKDYFSYRRDKQTGRFAGLMMLK